MPLPDLPLLFDFEIVSSENLTFIPMGVRFNLDRCGLHLTLDQWQALPLADRVALVRLPLALAGAHEAAGEGTEAVACAGAPDGSVPEAVVQARAAHFAAYLRERVSASSATPLEAQTELSDLSPPSSSSSSGMAAWARPGAVPAAVLKQCELHGTAPLSEAAWSRLAPFQRYVLVKLSRRSTPNHDFLPALREFCLL